MSNTVDNRAVHLGFDNKQFEEGTKQSTASLNALKKSLDLTEQTKGLQNFSDAAKSMQLSGIADGVQKISDRFSMFGIIGMTVLQNLTNKAIEFGQKLWQNIIGPAKQGFAEYEVQMNAIQTIMANTASKGVTLEQVNAVLDELNTYADKTIYNFSEMAKNIGTFTAAGVDLDTAAESIKGIGNLAAVSGANSQQAAMAMYQLSQAISSGTVRLQDWMSVEHASMGGEVFKNALIETARVHGIKIDEMIKKEGTFRLTLQEGWLSKEILTETLAKFTGDLNAEQLKSIGYTEEQIKEILALGVTASDAAQKVKTFSQLKQTLQESLQSGWAQSWRIMIGDFEEAKSFFTYLSDTFGGMIQSSSDARNAILQGWKDLGGRTLVIESVKNIFKGLTTVLNIFKGAWTGWFPKKDPAGTGLLKITKALNAFSKIFIPTSNTIKFFAPVFGGFFALLDIGRMAIVALASSFGKLNTSGLKPFLKTFTSYIENAGYYLINLRNMIKDTDYFGTKVKEISGRFSELKANVIVVIDLIREKFEKLKVAVETFKENLKNAFTFDKKVDTSGFSSFLDKIQERFNFKPFQTLLKVISFAFDGLISLLEKSGPTLLKIGSFFGKTLGGIGTAIMKAVAGLDFNQLFDLINEGLLGGLIVALTRFVNSGSLQAISGMFGGVSAILDQVRASLQAYQENLKSKTLLNIAIAVALLAASLVAISLIDSKKLTASLAAISGLFADLVLSMKGLSSGPGGKGAVGGAAGLALTLTAMSVSLLLIAAAVTVLANIDEKELLNGLASLGLISAGLAGFMRVVGTNSKSFVGSAISINILAVGLLIIASAVEKLGSMKVGVLQQGLIAIGIVITELALFTQLAGKMNVGTGVGILALVGAIILLGIAVEKFGTMKIAVLQQGLLALGAVLLGLAGFIRLAGNGKNVIATAIGMAILSGAMLVFVEAITRLGKIPVAELQRGLFGMAAALLAIVLAVNLLPKNMIVKAVGLAIIAGAIYILADSLTTMSKMTWEEIARGLATLAGAMLIISVAMYAMQGSMGGAIALLLVAGALAILAPVLKTLGGMGLAEIAIALGALAAMFVILGIAGAVLTPVVPTLLGLALAILAIGAAVALIGAGLLLFSAGLAALAVSGVAGATAFVAMVGILLGIIPMIIEALVGAIILFAKLIIEAVPVIAEALITLIKALCQVIIETVPDMVAALSVLLAALWQLIREQVPVAVETILFVIGELLASLAASIPDFTQSAFDILLGFLQGIRDNIAEVVTVVGEIITEFLDAVALALPDIIQSGFDLLLSFIEGITKAVEENGPDISAAVLDLAGAIITGLTDGLLGGIDSIVTAVGNIGSSIITALKTLLGIASPSRIMEEIGVQTIKGLLIGLRDKTNSIADATEDLGDKALKGMNGALQRINDSLNSNLDVNPTIRPVLDLTGVQNGSRNIDSILGTKSISLATNMNNLSNVAANMSSRNNTNDGINAATQQGATVIFNQTNTSPKALSAFDIYRNTRNQLLMVKGLVLNQ